MKKSNIEYLVKGFVSASLILVLFAVVINIDINKIKGYKPPPKKEIPAKPKTQEEIEKLVELNTDTI